jgi:hypothetical protein
MIFEAILRSWHTDLKIFYELRGGFIGILTTLMELNYFYKLDKAAWIHKRGKAIKREKEAQEEHEKEQKRRNLREKQKQKDPGGQREQSQDQRVGKKEIRIGQHQQKTGKIEDKSRSNMDTLLPEIEEKSNPDEDVRLVRKIEKKSRRDYAAYVYLVLKVRLEYPFLYKLINVICISLN